MLSFLLTKTEKYIAANLREKESEIGFVSGRGTTPTGKCSPGNHSHGDFDKGKCHKQDQSHRTKMPWSVKKIRKKVMK